MSSIIPVANLDKEAEEIVEDMRSRIVRSSGFGITVQGSHITLRWNNKACLRSVTMVVVDVDDGCGEPADPDLDK